MNFEMASLFGGGTYYLSILYLGVNYFYNATDTHTGELKTAFGFTHDEVVTCFAPYFDHYIGKNEYYLEMLIF